MKQTIALIALVTLVGTIAAGEPNTPAAKGLAVHEWGVFRVSEDSDFANAALRAEWDELPEFAYGHIKGRTVPQHWGAVEIRFRPIIFFHAEALVRVRVKVDFPGGMAGVWFPATEKPAVYANQKQPKVGDSLEWNLAVKQCPNDWRPRTPAPREVADIHWVSRIRKVKSDEIFALFSPNNADVERERFIFYDGLFPQGKWMAIKVEKEYVSLTNRVKHPLLDVTVVDRRGDKVRVGRIAKMDAGETVKAVPFEEFEPAGFSSRAADTLVKQLTAAGLFEDEAKSLADTWQRTMFETPGLHLFYRLPPSEYDARMPLTVTPKPESTVRVGLIFHSHLEPDFADRVLELVKQLDAPKFSDRDAARKKLLAIGPAALVQLQCLGSRKDLSVEVKERVESLIKKWSVKEAFDQ